MIFYPLVKSYEGRDYSFLKILFVIDVIYDGVKITDDDNDVLLLFY